MNTVELKQFIQSQLQYEYGFKPALEDIIPKVIAPAGGDVNNITNIIFGINNIDYLITRLTKGYNIRKLTKLSEPWNDIDQLLSELNTCLKNDGDINKIIKLYAGELCSYTFNNCPVYSFEYACVPFNSIWWWYIAIDNKAHIAYVSNFKEFKE